MELVLTILAGAIPILLAISLHEAAHGLVAYLFGDDTAKSQGRLTANPIKHIDPVGTVLVPLVLYLTTGFAFGWAKPVPVNMYRFANPFKDMALVALAGPASNLLMAALWYGFLLLLPQTQAAQFFITMAYIGVVINLLLMLINLLPIPPLDGGRIVMGVLPPQWALWITQREILGLLLVVLLMITGVLQALLGPLFESILSALKML